MKKRLISVLLAAATGLAMLTACGGREQGDPAATEKTAQKASEAADEGQEKAPEAGGKDHYTIGILQFAQHASLDNCRKGFLAGLAEAGLVEGENLTVDYQNANADMATNAQIADLFVSKKYDLIVPIATPSAMAAANAASGTDIPIVYTAINDPVGAKLADEDGKPIGNVTGTSDALPIEAQLKTMREILPEAKNLGILYTTSEANSEASIKIYEELAPKYGFNLLTASVSTGAEIPQATDSILGKVDCLSNLTDNTVVNSLPTILDKAEAKHIPVFGSEIEQVKIGCLAAEGIEYLTLGKETGALAADVLTGKAKAAELPYRTLKEPLLYVNEAVAKTLGIELSDQIKERAHETFNQVEVAN